MMTLDASAAIKLVIDEKGSEAVATLFDNATGRGESILAPDILIGEVINGLLTHMLRLKDINEPQFDSAMSSFMEIWNNITVIRTEAMLEYAIKIAKTQKIAIYDALYAAISIKEDAPILTFDEQLIKKCANTGLRRYGNALDSFGT